MQDFSINYLSANNFAAYPSSISESQVAFQFDFSSPVWSRLRVNFWASRNPQIQVGYFRVGKSHLMQTTSRLKVHATVRSHTLTSTQPSANQTTLSLGPSLTVSIFLPIPCKFLSAPPTLRAQSSPSRSPSVRPPISEGFGFPGWPSRLPLLPSALMVVRSLRTGTRGQ